MLYNRAMSEMKIAVVDYGAGNIYSVMNILRELGIKGRLTDDGQAIKEADGIILPGVGAFGYACDALKSKGLFGLLREQALIKPFLGICLGMQLLFDSSEESPAAEGLGLISGKVKKLKASGLKVPHMGWTSLDTVKGRLLYGIEQGEFFYFVHSYGAHCDQASDEAASSEYGEGFAAAVEKSNVFGCQFHPEKSGEEGKRVIKNFLALVNKEVRN